MKNIFREPLGELFEYEELKAELKAGRGPLQAVVWSPRKRTC